MRHFVAAVLVALLSACATVPGAQTITLSTTEIEQQIRVDLGGVAAMFKGLDAPRPQVSVMGTGNPTLRGAS